MKRLLFLIIFSAALFSVHGQSAGQGADGEISFDLDSFEHRALDRTAARQLPLGDLLLGRPVDLVLHPDEFVVVQDARSALKQISIIDIRDGSWEQLVSRGRGPLEAMFARDPDIFDGDVWVSGTQEGKMIRLAFDRSRRKFAAAAEFVVSGEAFPVAFPFAKSEFLILNGSRSTDRLSVVTEKGDVVRSGGSFPPVKVASGIEISNGLLQSNVTVSPDRRHTAIACRGVDYIDIFDHNLALVARLRGPMRAEPEFFYRKLSEDVSVMTQEPRLNVFGPGASNDSEFYVAYNGIEIKSREDLDKEPFRILSFDWRGRPQKCYTFDHPVWCFDVDAEGEKMYVATRDPESLEPEILIYDL